jgi:hypothetical protein
VAQDGENLSQSETAVPMYGKGWENVPSLY